MLLAANYGLTFQCDPMAVLDRPASDLAVVQSVLDAAHYLLKRSEEAAKR